ncbi:meiotic recombination protein Rec27 [Schizosaccharomyces cryophilus OY26]|uniref:Meiotic recombination protein Rec27 n=1 Tax=Schizosaccharomyces cryophilus (strain OY26 / ATCC MYA-4695 / CBS 11777 / NBRC 106824 / NRRL Y48691) TaxID=653667 RepID=S9X6S0_SCHCR|nr:meiotic recombination protein Rec27 [Schizosaccharomyces cryophilus OY26]EPY49471.1 meiotic recombination protein Rec27 [Schizosaccharomyces cryophilus OY26]
MKQRTETTTSNESNSDMIERVLEELSIKHMERCIRKRDQIEQEFTKQIEYEKSQLTTEMKLLQNKNEENVQRKMSRLSELRSRRQLLETQREALGKQIRQELGQYLEKLQTLVESN